MIAAQHKFSPRTVPSIFTRSARSKKLGYSILILPKEESGNKYAVTLSANTASTSTQRHAVKRKVYQLLDSWMRSGEPAAVEKEASAFYLIVMIQNWNQAQTQLRTQDWKETVEYLLKTYSNT